MSTPKFCYHCGKFHPEAEMRQIFTKGGNRWRCIKSIQAIKKIAAERDAFGKRVSAANTEMQSLNNRPLAIGSHSQSMSPGYPKISVRPSYHCIYPKK